MHTHNVNDMRDLRNRWLLLNEQFQLLEKHKEQKKQDIMKHIDQMVIQNLGQPHQPSTGKQKTESATTTSAIATHPRKIGEFKEKKLKEKKLKEKKLKEKKLKEKKLKEKKLKEKKLKEKKLKESLRRLLKKVQLLKRYTA